MMGFVYQSTTFSCEFHVHFGEHVYYYISGPQLVLYCYFLKSSCKSFAMILLDVQVEE